MLKNKITGIICSSTVPVSSPYGHAGPVAKWTQECDSTHARTYTDTAQLHGTRKEEQEAETRCKM